MRIQNLSFSGITLSTVWVSLENRARKRPEGVTWKWQRGARSVAWSKEMCMTRAAHNAPLQANRVLQNIVSTRIQQPRHTNCDTRRGHTAQDQHTSLSPPPFLRHILTKIPITSLLAKYLRNTGIPFLRNSKFYLSKDYNINGYLLI